MNLPPPITILRPHHWLKNLILVFPPFLGGALLNPGMLSRGVVPFFAFSFASSASYILNDLLDRENDRNHPSKKHRPLASGSIAFPTALLMIFIMLGGAGGLGWLVSYKFLAFLATYLIVSGLYSFLLKEWPIVDIFCVAFGFVLRLYAGGEAFGVLISDWLFLSVFLLALFLSVGKRYSESMTLGVVAGQHRSALEKYPHGFLESVLYLSGAAVLVTYSLYVINRTMLIYTVPLCMFGLLRYLFCVKSGQSGDPTHALLRDVPLMITGVVWMIMVAWGVYR